MKAWKAPKPAAGELDGAANWASQIEQDRSNGKATDLDYHATVIQSQWRGHYLRRSQAAAANMSSKTSHTEHQQGARSHNEKGSEYYATVIQSQWRGHVMRKSLQRPLAAGSQAPTARQQQQQVVQPQPSGPRNLDHFATVIQSQWRGHHVRKSLSPSQKKARSPWQEQQQQLQGQQHGPSAASPTVPSASAPDLISRGPAAANECTASAESVYSSHAEAPSSSAMRAATAQQGGEQPLPLLAAAGPGYGLLESTGYPSLPEDDDVADELDHEQKVLFRNVGALRAAARRCGSYCCHL